MRALRPTGYPADRTAGRWVSDVLLTLLALVTTLPALPRDSTRMHAAEVVVLAISVAPLVVRRIWPLPVFGWILLTAIAAGLWDKQRGRRAWPCSSPCIPWRRCGRAGTRWSAPACSRSSRSPPCCCMRTADWWFDAIFVSGMIAAALGLGLYFATRRAYLAELHDRAERLERERDQQAALAAAAERARIAREMHDIVAHHLTVMTTLSRSGGRGVGQLAGTGHRRHAQRGGHRAPRPGRYPPAPRRPARARRPGQDSAEALQPVPDLSQLDALIEQVRSAGLDTTLESTGRHRTCPRAYSSRCTGWCRRPSPTRSSTAGRAPALRVRLSFAPGELRVDVDDDGAGRAAPAAAGVGGGLLGMRERVHAYGGDVQAGPRQPAGWAVSARLPLDNGETT